MRPSLAGAQAQEVPEGQPYGIKRNKSTLRIEIRSFRKAEGFNPQR
jgi:hypothetical protein